MFRGLCIYLSVYLCFPPQVWAHAGDPPATPPSAPPAAMAPVPNADADRKELLETFHQASWRLSKIVKARIPAIRKLKAPEYFTLLQSYELCRDPFTAAPDSIQAIDAKVLQPVQAALAKFLVARASEIGKLGFESDSPSVPVVVAPLVSAENGALCQPIAWRNTPESSDPLAVSLDAGMRAFQEPLYLLLSRRLAGPVTDVEIRRWVGWLSSMREFRHWLAKYYQFKEKEDYVPSPELRLPAAVGAAVARGFQSEKSNIASTLASQILSGGMAGPGVSELPRLGACASGPEWCLADGKRAVGLDVDESILLSLQAGQRTVGRDLDALRKVAVKALLSELVTVNALLPGEGMPLNAACRESGDLDEHRRFFAELSTVDESQWWIQRFGDAVSELEKGYREGRYLAPVPADGKFYETANGIAREGLESYFTRATFRAAGTPTPTENPAKKRVMDALRAYSFRDRLLEADRAGSGLDYGGLLQEKLKIWFVLVQQELGAVKDGKLRRDAITEMLQHVVATVLGESLEHYVVSLARDEGLDLETFTSAWREKSAPKWREWLAAEPGRSEVKRIAEAISGVLLSNPLLQQTFDGAKIADEALTNYARRVAPRVREAAAAEDTSQFMRALVEWRRGPWNLVPSPWNFHWQEAGWGALGPLGGTREFDTSSPAFFQMDDGSGRGYGYTMSVPDAVLPDEYVHIQGALEAVAERHRDKLIEKLKARGYSDEGVRREFGAQAVRNVGTLADLVLRKFNEAVKAEPSSDRGRGSVSRERALSPLLAWLKSPFAPREYRELTRNFAGRLFDRYFSSLLREVGNGRGRPELEETLKRVTESEILIGRPSVDALLRNHEAFRRNLESEREPETIRAARAEIQRNHQVVLDSNATASAETWKTFCAKDVAACRAWIESRLAPLKGSQARNLYDWRLASHTESALLEFLRYFGGSRPAYDGRPISDVARAAVVTQVKESLARGWLGWIASNEANVAAQVDADALLVKVSSAASEGKLSEETVLAHREDWKSLQDKYFPKWNEALLSASTAIFAALGTNEAAKLTEIYPKVHSLIHRELFQTYALPSRELASAVWKIELSKALLPEFPAFREAIERKTSVELAPGADASKELSEATTEIRRLKDLQWSLDRAGKRESREFARAGTQLAFEERKLERARGRLKNSAELRLLLSNYLEGSPIAMNVLGALQSGALDVATQFFEDQFLSSTIDATGRPLDLKPAEILADLNAVAAVQLRPWSVTKAIARKFLASVTDYCGLSKGSLESAFGELYRKAIEGQPAAAPVKQFCDEVTSESNRLVSLIPADVEWGKEWEDAYWRLVLKVSPVFFSVKSPFGPLVDESGKLHWFESGPTSEVRPLPGSDLAQKEEMKDATRIQAFLESFSLNNEQWTKLLAGASQPPAGDTSEGRRQWLNALTPSQRALVVANIEKYLGEKLRSAGDTAGYRGATANEASDYAGWHRLLRRYLVYWDKLKGELSRSGAALDAPKHAIFEELAASVLRLFVSVAPYHFDGTRLVLGKKSLEESMAPFAAASKELRRRILEDVEELYNVELRRLAREQTERILRRAEAQRAVGALPSSASLSAIEPFRFASVTNVSLPGVSAREGALRFFVREFVSDPSDTPSAERLTAAAWRSHFQARQGIGSRADAVDVERFTWDGTFKGVRGTEATRYATWVGNLKRYASARSAFAELKKLAPDGRRHLWDRYPSLEAFAESDLNKQLNGLLAVADNNARALWLPKTYGYFLGHLSWNIRRYGRRFPIGPVPQAMPPSDRLIAKLLEDLVAVMELDLKSFTGWQTLLRKQGRPEDWLQIADSRRNLLVGAGERRFLGTLVEAPRSSNPIWAAPDYNYRPFPIVDREERSRLASPREFNDWWIRTENPATSSLYRVSADDHDKRPLFAQLVAAQNEMLGERDIAQGNPLERARFRERQGNWQSVHFGDIAFSEGRITQLVSRAELHDLKTSADEMKRLATTRESLVDFRRTLGELNLRYSHESARILQGRGNDIPQRRDFISELTDALKRYAKQLGSEEPPPDLRVSNPRVDGSDPSLADKRREAIARAIYWASSLAHEKVFKKATDENDKKRLEKLLSVIDGFYTEEGQKIEIRRGLKVVAGNIDKQLGSLCAARALSDISTEEEFKAARKLVLEDAKLVYFDNLIQLLYIDSGWTEDGGDQPQTRRLLVEMAREQADHKKTMETVGTVVNWLIAISLVLLLFGKSNPAMMRVAAGSRITQGVLLTVTYLAAAGFAAMETYQIYEDYWGRPDEIALLAGIRDTQFLGVTPLMKDESASLIPEGTRQIEGDQRSLFRWSMHLLGFSAGAQALSPVLKWAKGSAKYLLAMRNPMRAINARFLPHARALGLSPGATPYQAVEGLSRAEAEARMLQAYAKATNGRVLPGGTIELEADTVATLQRDAIRQKEQLAKELGLDAETLLPIAEEQATGNLRRWDPRRLQAEFLENARAQARGRLEFLRDLIRRLGQNRQLTADDIVRLVGMEADPALRHTPFIWSLFGVPYPSRLIRDLRKLRALAQADLDILAIHDPQVLQMVAFLNQLNLPGARFERWELFSSHSARRFWEIPRDLRKVFEDILKDARYLAERAAKAPGVVYDTPMEREMRRLSYPRECFEDVLTGMTVRTDRYQLVEMYRARLDKIAGNRYSPSALEYYKELFLSENGLSILPSAKSRMNAVHQLANWRAASEAQLNMVAREHNATVEDVIYWMVTPTHPNYRLFARPPEAVEAPVIGSIEELGMLPDSAPARSLHEIAEELRGFFRVGKWFPDTELLKAIAKADYGRMATRLVRWRQVAEPTGAEPLGQIDRFVPDEGMPTEPETPPANVTETPRPPSRPARPELPTEPVTPPQPPGPADIPEDILASRTFGPVLEFDAMMRIANGKIPVADRKLAIDLLLNRVSAADLQRAMGRLRRAGKLTSEVESGYQLAIATTRAMELAERMPTQAERLELFQWMMEIHVSHTERVIASPMSVAEAREILGIARDRWPFLTRIEELAAEAKAAGVDAAVVDKAASLLKRVHPTGRDLTSLEDVALLLDLPVECLASESVAKSLAMNRVSREPDAESMLRHLFQHRFNETVQDAFRVLGLPGDSTAEAIAKRVNGLKRSLATRAEATADEGAKAFYRSASQRVERAEYILANRAQFPAKFEPPEVIIPRYEIPEGEVSADPFFQARIGEYPADIIDRMVKKGIDKARQELWQAIAEGKVEAGGLSTAEEVSRLIHASLIYQNARSAKCVTTPEALEEVARILVQRYVKNAHIQFDRIPSEAEEFIYAFYKARLGYSRSQVKLHKDENFQKFIDALIEEEALAAQGKGNIPKPLFDELTKAAAIMRLSRQGATGIESLVLNTNSHAPMELIVSLIRQAEANPKIYPEIRKLVYQLLDGPNVRWRSDGTHPIGDLFLTLFGPTSGVKVPVRDVQGTARALYVRFLHAERVGDAEAKEMYEQAVKRLVGEEESRPASTSPWRLWWE